MYSRKASLNPSGISAVPLTPFKNDLRRQSAAPFTLTVLEDSRDEPKESLALKTLIHPTLSNLPLRQDGTIFLRIGRKLSHLMPGGETEEMQNRRPSLKIDMQTEVHVLTEDGRYALAGSRRGSSARNSTKRPSVSKSIRDGRDGAHVNGFPRRSSQHKKRWNHHSRSDPSTSSDYDSPLSSIQYRPTHTEVDSIFDLSTYSLHATHPKMQPRQPVPVAVSPLDSNVEYISDPSKEVYSHHFEPKDQQNHHIRAVKEPVTLRGILCSIFGVEIGRKHGKGKLRVAKSALTVARKSSLKKRKTPSRPITETGEQHLQQVSRSKSMASNNINGYMSTTGLSATTLDRQGEQLNDESTRRKVSLPSFLSLI